MRDKRLDGRPTSPEELLLIRAGHHLWKSQRRKEWPEKAVSQALETIWSAKEALRVELRQEWLNSREKRISDFQQRVARKKGK